jgi:hypothetical protein
MDEVCEIQALADNLRRLASSNSQTWFSGKRVAGVGYREVWKERCGAGVLNSSKSASFVVEAS